MAYDDKNRKIVGEILHKFGIDFGLESEVVWPEKSISMNLCR